MKKPGFYIGVSRDCMPKTPALQIFCTMKKYRNCFVSEEYRHIMHERVDNVDAMALIVEGET